MSVNIPELNKSGEDYLETILLLDQKTSYVRGVDIAESTGYTKPSVSNALKLLREKGLVKVDGGRIILTDDGRDIAQRVYKRHSVLRIFFKDILGVSSEVAERDACSVEHIISEESFCKLEYFVKNRK